MSAAKASRKILQSMLLPCGQKTSLVSCLDATMQMQTLLLRRRSRRLWMR
jgi:hypothetical protein